MKNVSSASATRTRSAGRLDITQDPGAIPPIVLLADDVPARRATCRQALEREGIWVATAATPEETLGGITELRPDLIVAAAPFQTVS